MKKVLIIIGCVLGAVVVICAVAFFIMMNSAKSVISEVDNMNIVDLNTVKDGTYTGDKDAGLVKVEVKVTVKDHKIENIDLVKHDNGKGKPAEAMIDEMIKDNTCDVDGVSGATLSSCSIKAAVNDALSKGVEGK